MKIAIFGLGGVGGYFAAQATEYFKDRADMEFYYIARGEHLEAIKRDGLRLTRDGELSVTAHPHLATDRAEQCGKVDYVIYATKSYSVESSIEALRAITDENSVIITFMNGVDGAEKLRQALPHVTICEGCVYVFSMIDSPGVIAESGGRASYQVGFDPINGDRVKSFCELVSPAIDKIEYFDDVEAKIWRKFSFISPYATITSQFNISSDQVVSSDEYRTIFRGLCEEFAAVAKALGKEREPDYCDKCLELLASFPAGTTSSMQRDFHSSKMCEVGSLTSYVSEMGAKHGIPTPHYDRAVERITQN